MDLRHQRAWSRVFTGYAEQPGLPVPNCSTVPFHNITHMVDNEIYFVPKDFAIHII